MEGPQLEASSMEQLILLLLVEVRRSGRSQAEGEMDWLIHLVKKE
jgi:hypothetical protein